MYKLQNFLKTPIVFPLENKYNRKALITVMDFVFMLHAFSPDYKLASHTTYVMCVNFIYK